MDDDLADMATGRMALPLCHPEGIIADREYDLSVVRMIAHRNTLCSRILNFIGLFRLIFFKG